MTKTNSSIFCVIPKELQLSQSWELRWILIISLYISFRRHLLKPKMNWMQWRAPSKWWRALQSNLHRRKIYPLSWISIHVGIHGNGTFMSLIEYKKVFLEGYTNQKGRKRGNRRVFESLWLLLDNFNERRFESCIKLSITDLLHWHCRTKKYLFCIRIDSSPKWRD